MSRRLEAPPTGEYDVQCPNCRENVSVVLESGRNVWRCDSCATKVEFLLAVVRAKRGKNYRSRGSFKWREYSVRYIDSSGEGLLEFRSNYSRDMELRSRDIMIAVFGEDKDRRNGRFYKITPLGIYNISINRYYPR